jgi:transcription elongation factor GreA
MTFRPFLSSVLRGEEAAELTPENRARLEALAVEAETEGALVLLRDECAGRQRQPGCSIGTDYLLGIACARHGDQERALQTLLALGERLAGEENWEPLAAVAERSLALGETQAGARLLVRAHEGLGVDPARLEALEWAFAVLGDDLDLGLLFAQRLGEAGLLERRLELLTGMLPAFAAQDRFVGLEEAALEFVERGAADGLVELLRVLPGPAERGALDVCEQLVGIAFPEVARAGRAGECEAALRDVVASALAHEGGAGGARFRDALVEALRQGTAAGLPDAAAVIAVSGVAEPARPLAEALERFGRIAALPPGRAVWHGTFQAGRVREDDGDAVVLDFARSKGHRMPYASALRSLQPLSEDDLRVLQLTRPGEVTRLRAEEPAEMVARALGALGGEGDAQRLKVFLVGADLVAAKDWNSFWRQARAALPSHPRVDAARAFEQSYRLRRGDEPAAAPGESPEAPLPGLEVRKPARANLATLRKFLVQHPNAETALAQRFGRFVERAMLDEHGECGDRVRAGLYFARWFPERAGEWRVVLGELWEQGLAVTDLAGEAEQSALLALSHAAGVGSDAILSALDSRFSSVREEAERLRGGLDDEGRREMRHTLLVHAPRYPGAATRLIEDELETGPGPAPRADTQDPDTQGAGNAPPADAWLLLWSALTLIEDRPKRSIAEKVQRWLEPDGAFAKLLAGQACPAEVQLKVRVLFRSWRSSDRYLFPALEAVDHLGLSEEAAVIRAERQKAADKLFRGVGQQVEGTELPVMTHATWERLKGELERLERELKTTIPAAIQKARELGDLSENAEYHSAKLKQANASRLVAALQLRLARARFVDDAEYRDGIVGLGTEVVIESDGQELRTYWVLGEDEHHLGENVISFQTPVGRALSGLAIGDEVELGEGTERRHWRVVSVERKLPGNAT